jgi:hypothetical protein
MIELGRSGARVFALLLAAGMLAGCATTGGGGAASASATQVTAVPESAVSSDSLPPIGGNGAVQVASAGPTVVGSTPADPNAPPSTGAMNATNAAAPGSATPLAPGTQQAFVSLNDVGKVSATPGRDLTGGLTVEKLLGGWTVSSGVDQCRLNLTYTSANPSDAHRYRASAPGCQVQALAAVSSWQLAGTQVQLFNDAGTLVGALLLSGNRFVGTLSGGQAVSMVG